MILLINDYNINIYILTNIMHNNIKQEIINNTKTICKVQGDTNNMSLFVGIFMIIIVIIIY